MNNKQNDLTEDYKNSICPVCKIDLLEHNTIQLVVCAQKEITKHDISKMSDFQREVKVISNNMGIEN